MLFKRKSKDNRYRCTRCGNCCRWPGYVRLADREGNLIAEHLGLTSDQFLARYTRLTADRKSLSLTEKPDGACCFLHGESECRIQEVKPRQCRNFPNLWNFPGFEQDCCAVDTWKDD